MCGLSFFRLVEDEVAFPVERFQVGLYARGLVGLFLLVAPDVQRDLVLFADFGHQWLEHLLEERVLQLVVLHVAIYRRLPVHELQQLDIPPDELRVQRLCEKSLYDVKLSSELAEQGDRLERLALLAFAFARRRVAVCDQELELRQGGTLP